MQMCTCTHYTKYQRMQLMNECFAILNECFEKKSGIVWQCYVLVGDLVKSCQYL